MFDVNDLEYRYSVITLPSEGIYYENKCKQVKLFHLVGGDLTILTDANLIRNGNVVSYLLNKKVTKSETSNTFIHPDKMLVGDRMALLMMLRIHMNPQYIFPVRSGDGRVNVAFDLTTLKTKEINVLPDENGLHTFTYHKTLYKNGAYVPIDVKFRLLTGEDENLLRKYESNIENDKTVNKNYTIEKLILLTEEIDGNTDKEAIRKFYNHCDLEEMIGHNKYITDITPGLDLNIKVELPGGELVEMFFPFNVNFLLPGVLSN